MRICVIGTGYVGLVSGACLADVGNTVWCVDKDQSKISLLKSYKIPIYEPGLQEIVKRGIDEDRLFFTTDLAESLKDAEICFITVDTPPDGDGRADLTNVLAVAEQIGKILDHPVILTTKSTVPVGTTLKVKEVVSNGLKLRGLDVGKLLRVAFNPEFLKEGAAVEDFMKPDRVVVGVEDKETGRRLHELYKPFMRREDRFVEMSVSSSEITKYAANAMLATRISFMNDMARLCECVGADINDVRNALGSDPRIGPDFLYAGLGYGGSCFPKDTKAIISLGQDNNSRLSVVEAVDRANDEHREWFWTKICAHFGGETGIKGKNISIWGVAFKANTDDVRFAPSLFLIRKFIKAGACISAYDPAAVDNAKLALGELSEKISWAENYYNCAEGSDALVICTEWLEFRSPDFGRMKSLMRSPVIFDGRNLYDPEATNKLGFNYTGVGRQVFAK